MALNPSNSSNLEQLALKGLMTSLHLLRRASAELRAMEKRNDFRAVPIIQLTTIIRLMQH